MKKSFIQVLLLSSILIFGIGTGYTQDVLSFPHKYHIEEEEMACADCHSGVNESISGFDDLLPVKEVCADCHDVEDEENCNMCHSNAKMAKNVNHIKDYSELFSHQKHISSELECASCHGDVGAAEIGVHLAIPDMVDCMSCHSNNFVSNDCMTCHKPGEQLKPGNHNLTFASSHGNLAQFEAITVSRDMTCATCHKQTFCQDCHEGENIDRSIHPLNFEFTHALQAQGKENNCYTCHENRSFCSSCHTENNVLPHNHTAGWATLAGDGGRHRIEALIDLDNCMSCHERNAEEVCAQCHK